MTESKIVGIVPARLASTRFPNKMLYPIFNHPMIEHVLRRAVLSEMIDEIYVATCDDLIAEVVHNAGGKTIMTSNHHLNGTSRAAEAIKEIDCSHVILLLGDEPLLLPSHVDRMVAVIRQNPEINAWKAIGPIDTVKSLQDPSIVKCVLGLQEQILYCFRKSPSISSSIHQKNSIKKLLGASAFRKDFLLGFENLNIGLGEECESIEELRFLENGFTLRSILFEESLPSINEKKDLKKLYKYIEKFPTQKNILKQIFNYTPKK